MTRNLLTLPLAVLAVAMPTGTALAAPDQDDAPVIVRGQPMDSVATRIVRFGDLDLAGEAGRKALHHRVGNAVRSVCLEATGPNALDWAEVACRKDSWGRAKPQMAKAFEQAQQIASTGGSAVGLVAITISARR